MSGREQLESAGQVVADYWAAAEARDWVAFGALLADDVVYEVPQTRERVSGRDAYVRLNAEGFPGDWHLAVERIVSQDRTAVSMIQFSEGDASQPGLCFFDLDEQGRIVHIQDFWPGPYESPAGTPAGADQPRGEILDEFRAKYGAQDVAVYYPKPDAAEDVPLD